MKHIYQLSQDLLDMLKLDASEEDIRTNPEARKAAKEIKKIQKRIEKLDEAFKPRSSNLQDNLKFIFCCVWALTWPFLTYGILVIFATIISS